MNDNFWPGLLIGLVVGLAIGFSVMAAAAGDSFSAKHCQHIDSRSEFKKCKEEFLK